MKNLKNELIQKVDNTHESISCPSYSCILHDVFNNLHCFVCVYNQFRLQKSSLMYRFEIVIDRKYKQSS